MAGRDPRLNLIINHGKQLGRSLLLLAYYTTVFMVFVGRFVEWMVYAVKWTGLFGRYTASTFDFIYRCLHRRKRRNMKKICPKSNMEPQ